MRNQRKFVPAVDRLEARKVLSDVSGMAEMLPPPPPVDAGAPTLTILGPDGFHNDPSMVPAKDVPLPYQAPSDPLIDGLYKSLRDPVPPAFLADMQSAIFSFLPPPPAPPAPVAPPLLPPPPPAPPTPAPPSDELVPPPNNFV